MNKMEIILRISEYLKKKMRKWKDFFKLASHIFTLPCVVPPSPQGVSER